MPKPTRFRAWLAAGLACFLLLSWLNRPGLWRPAAVVLAAGENRLSVPVEPGRRYEIAIEVDETTAPGLRTEILRAGLQDALQGDWQVECGAGMIARGDLSDYRRVAEIRPLSGRLRRIVLRVPFGQDARSYWSFGLAGAFTGERSVGAFSAETDSVCTVSLTTRAWPEDAAAGNTRLVLRRDHAEWRAHYDRVVVLAYLGALCLAVALADGLRRLFSGRRHGPTV
jgi:hypothetical protein